MQDDSRHTTGTRGHKTASAATPVVTRPPAVRNSEYVRSYMMGYSSLGRAHRATDWRLGHATVVESRLVLTPQLAPAPAGRLPMPTILPYTLLHYTTTSSVASINGQRRDHIACSRTVQQCASALAEISVPS